MRCVIKMTLFADASNILKFEVRKFRTGNLKGQFYFFLITQ
jgi:hypothetical protein